MSFTKTSSAPASLSSLCSSCHAAIPRYRCPRCSARTCSLACSKTHKARTLCSGVRDPGAYASRAQLNTPAAFDRDFNFISGVERGIERAARESERRGIRVDGVPAPQAAGGGRGGRGSLRGGRGSSRDVPGFGAGHGAERLKRGEAPLLKSLERDDITVLRAPKGMSRETENRTHWRRKGGGVSWTVEWIEVGSLPEKSSRCARGTSQLYENLPVREGFVGWQTAIRGVKRKREGTSKPAGDQITGKADENEEKWLGLEAVGKQSGPSTRMLLPFDSSIRLKDLLRGQTIREFPTIYAWQGEQGPGPGFELMEKLEKPAVGPQGEDSQIASSKDPATDGPEVAELTASIAETYPGAEEGNDSDDCFDEAGDEETARASSNRAGQLEIERDVYVDAESKLGIGGAIAAALTADMGEQEAS